MLPDDPLEPYLLTKENGPFMVLAKVFRGPDSERMALALCKELRQDFGLPAYILRSKEFPMKSYIRGTPVQAPSVTTKSAIKQPEQVRIHDEAAVLVGNEKTLAGQRGPAQQGQEAPPQVPRRHAQAVPLARGALACPPDDQSLRPGPVALSQGAGPAGRPDELGPQEHRQLPRPLHAPGRAVHRPHGLRPQRPGQLDRAEHPRIRAAARSRRPTTTPRRWPTSCPESPEIKQLGQPVFVYHDRTSSRVFVGSFNSPQDPAIVPVHGELLKAAGKLNAQGQAGPAAIDQYDRPGHS